MPFENKEIVQNILETLNKKRFKTYIVGGAVRDTMLGRIPCDTDLLTNAGVDDICTLFSDQKVKVVGKSFSVCMVNGVEVSSGKETSGNMTFPESDLARRDFTFNAMACDMEKKIIIDPFNGRKDLEDGIVRFTENPEKRITEDPIRMVRACRFAAMIEGSFEKETFDGILEYGSMLDEGVAKERIQIEIKKAMGLRQPSLFFAALRQTELLAKIFPSLDRCYGLSGGPHHGEDVFEHCMLVGDALPDKSPILRLAGFLHDTGKFDSARIKDGQMTFAGHENEYRHAVHDLEVLRFSLKEIAYIKALIQSHMRPLTDESTPKAVRKLLLMLDSFHLDYKDFFRMRIADRKGNLAKSPYALSEIRTRLAKLFDEINSQNAFSMKDLRITGDDIVRILGIDPGPEVGRIKDALFEKVLEDPGLNNITDLMHICRSLKIEK